MLVFLVLFVLFFHFFIVVLCPFQFLCFTHITAYTTIIPKHTKGTMNGKVGLNVSAKCPMPRKAQPPMGVIMSNDEAKEACLEAFSIDKAKIVGNMIASKRQSPKSETKETNSIWVNTNAQQTKVPKAQTSNTSVARKRFST